MPLFEFKCENCENTFEELLSDKSEQVRCPNCNSKNVKRMMSTFGTNLSGKTNAAGSGASCGPCSATSCSTCK